jgi:hypothetical protein
MGLVLFRVGMLKKKVALLPFEPQRCGPSKVGPLRISIAIDPAH